MKKCYRFTRIIILPSSFYKLDAKASVTLQLGNGISTDPLAAKGRAPIYPYRLYRQE